MLLQSQNGEIELLPALPSAWPNGSVTGLRARGQFLVGITWKDGQLVSATIEGVDGDSCQVRYRDKVVTLRGLSGSEQTLDKELDAATSKLQLEPTPGPIGKHGDS